MVDLHHEPRSARAQWREDDVRRGYEESADLRGRRVTRGQSSTSTHIGRYRYIDSDLPAAARRPEDSQRLTRAVGARRRHVVRTALVRDGAGIGFGRLGRSGGRGDEPLAARHLVSHNSTS